MLWAQEYARANRDRMMDRALREIFGFLKFGRETFRVNCHHNFCELETHEIDGQPEQVWVTRKGAIRARQGDWGIIPGSMGTKSYLVRGRGNPLSWQSCSHGAGRTMSRTAAKKRFSAADLVEQMAGRTWLAERANALIDEIPSAYKDIDAVMAAQDDLVEVAHTLHQILNYKGT